MDELAWVGTTWNNRKFLANQDWATNSIKQNNYFPSWFTPTDMSSVSYYWGGIHNYLLTLGNTTDGKKAWAIFTKNAGTPLASHAFPLWFTPKKVASLPRTKLTVDFYTLQTSGYRVEDYILISGETSDGKDVIMMQNSYDWGDGINTLTTIVLPSNFKPVY